MDPAPYWEREDQDGAIVLRLTPRLILGIELVHALRDDLVSLIERDGCHHLVLDFQNVELVDSLFISTLFLLIKRFRDDGGRLAFAGLSPTINEIFSALAMHFENVLGFFPDVPAAICWCCAPAPMS